MPREMIIVENVNHLGQTARLDAVKYKAARTAMLKVLPNKAPGMTQHEMMVAMRKALPTGAVSRHDHVVVGEDSSTRS